MRKGRVGEGRERERRGNGTRAEIDGGEARRAGLQVELATGTPLEPLREEAR